MNNKYLKIVLYGDRERYQQLKDKLGGIPMSVWFRVKVEEALADENLEKRVNEALHTPEER